MARPDTLMGFRDFHAGERMIVAGLGPSIVEARSTWLPTIGVHDIERHLAVDYVLVTDPEREFTQERWAYIKDATAKVFYLKDVVEFDQRPNSIPFEIRSTPIGRTPILPGSNGVLPTDLDSPHAALQLAVWMGASEIGLIGVDHDGSHRNTGWLAPWICQQYGRWADFYSKQGISVVKLSQKSQLPMEFVPFEIWAQSG